MKQTLKTILALAMILCMVFTAVGCGEKEKEVASEQQVAVDDSFFDAATTTNQAKDTESKDESKDSNTGKTDSSKKDNKDTGKKSSILPDENKIGGKSWNDVLASMPKKLRNTKLIMYNWNPAAEYTGAPEVIEQFTKQTGIKVDWRTITYSNYFTKLPALISSGENIPDMVRCRGPQPSFMENLQPIHKATGYDFSDEAWDQKLMELYTYGDNTFATSLQNTHIGCVSLMFFNQSLVDKYSLENPYKLWKAGKWDWNKYIKMCREYAELTGDNGSNGEGHFGLYCQFFGIQGAISYNGKEFYNAMKEKQFLEVHQKLGDFYNKEKLFAFGNAERFDDNKVLFSIGSAVHLRRKNSYFGNLKNANTLMAVPFPKINGQKKYYQGLGEAEAYGVAEGAPNPTAVPYFLRYFLDGSNYELSNYFGNKQNLEVYNWCMNQKNKIFSYGYPTGMAGINNPNTIEAQQGGQMQTYINANYGVTDKAVKEYNAILKKLKAK